MRSTHSAPATTSVAACITELTAVGPSIASGNQLCIPTDTSLTLSMITTSVSACVAMYCQRIAATIIYPSTNTWCDDVMML